MKDNGQPETTKEKIIIYPIIGIITALFLLASAHDVAEWVDYQQTPQEIQLIEKRPLMEIIEP